jgi:hypothetical protein
MKKALEIIEIHEWNESFSENVQNKAVEALESGKILYFPTLSFPLSVDELLLLTPEIMDPKAKNISLDPKSDKLAGVSCKEHEKELCRAMIKRFALSSRKLLHSLIPHYDNSIIQAKTSFRPVEISGRKTSYRKDDTRLHVDSFPSNPVKGERILRIFTNINNDGKPRLWRAGEPFQDVVNHWAPKASRPIPGLAQLLELIKITKSRRSPYDHYMLQMHDLMKADMEYQKSCNQEEISFPPGSSWAVFTDQVSHAAMSGQHVLEQTFYLPVKGQKYPQKSPLAVLERYFQKSLV